MSYPCREAKAELRIKNEIGRNGNAIRISKIIQQLFDCDLRLLQNGLQVFGLISRCIGTQGCSEPLT